MASSQGPLTPGRKSRRSWFDTPPLTSLGPKPVQDENALPPKKSKRKSIDTVETLTLTHFTSAPRLGFGNAVVGTTKFRTLIIRNPHDFEQEVIIEKFPFKKKFYVDHTRFEVAPGDVFSLEITWTPEEATGVREMVQFHINGVYRLQCYLFGTAENPKPIRKTTRRRKFCPPVNENSVVIQTPALTRIKSNYNPRRSQELRDVQALVESKEFHHNNAKEKNLHDEPISKDTVKTIIKDCKPPSQLFNNQDYVFARPTPLDPVTPTVLESTAIGAGLKHDGEILVSSQQTHAKWKKMACITGSENDNSMMTMSPIPVISDGNQNGMTIDSFFRPSEMGVKDEKFSSERAMKDTFVVPQVPSSQLEPDFPGLTFVCPADIRCKDSDVIEKNQCLSSTVCVSANRVNRKEMTYNIANDTLTAESCRSKLTSGEKSNTSLMSPSAVISEFSKRIEMQSPQKAGKLDSSADLSSMSPNTILDQSLSFIVNVSTPVKNHSNHHDMDTNENTSLISAGQGLVSPNSFMEEMKGTGLGGNGGINDNDSSIPSPSSVFNDSIPHNVIIKHLDNVNVSLMSNSPLFQSLKSKERTKRRSLTTAYRVAEKKRSLHAKNSPPKSRGSKTKQLTGKKHSPLKKSMKGQSLRSPFGKIAKQVIIRSPSGKPISAKVLTRINKQNFDNGSDESTPVKQLLKTTDSDSGTVVKNQSSAGNSFSSHCQEVASSSNFESLSPSCLPASPNQEANMSSRRCTLTVTKSRPSNALLAAMNNNRKQLFDDNLQPFVHFAETETRTDNKSISNSAILESGQKSENLESTQSPSNQFSSPTHQNLPNSPNPENSRRSTHVVKSPKVLDLSSVHQKRLNFDNSGNSTIPSLETEIKSQQNSPITSVCLMSPRVVDYEITSEEGSTSQQSVSIDSLETSNCDGKAAISLDGSGQAKNTPTVTLSGLECEYRVDVLNDTRSEEGVVFTSLKTPHKELDWSFCERGDTKVLPPKMDIAATVTYGQRNEMEAVVTTSVDYVVSTKHSVIHESKQNCSMSDTLEKSRQESFNKKKLRRSISAQEIHSSEYSFDSAKSQIVNKFSLTQNDTSSFRSSKLKDCGKSTKPSKTMLTSHLQSAKNPSQRLRSNPTSIEKEKTQQKSLGNRSLSWNNISKHGTSGSKGRVMRQDLPQAPTMKPVKTNLQSAKTGMNKPKKIKGPVKGVAQSKLILVKKLKNAVPRHPMPFAARNMYYDERWMEKQESGFAQWLNFVLTPPDEYVAVTAKPKVDAVALTLGNQHQGVASRLAPTKEVLSFRAYAARRRLNRLRRAACQLYQSDEVARIIRKIEVEVESQRIVARKDRMLHADLGIKQRVLDLLLQYSSLWLRIGLETVFGEVLPLHSNTDIVGLSRFVVTRLLSCPDIADQYAHPSVPHLYTEGFASAMSRHTVKKFLLLVYFMDRAKTLRLIDHDPCLFCKDADIKSSKEILIQFSCDLLSGEGDLTRHLAYLGYTVCQVQRPIDEFDYAVKNISCDLKDGLRLSRLLELLADHNGIIETLRTPAISRLQKIHNMEVFFSAMAKRGLKLEETGTTARDVVDGHREKTLSMLWHLILHFQANLNVDEEKLKEEIHLLTKSLQLKLAMQKIGAAFMEDCQARRDSGDSTTFVNNPRMELIFRWCRLVCLHYGVKIENMTVSFSDGRALCCLLHHYHPVLLPLSDICFHTTQQFQEAAEEVCDGEDPNLSIDWGKQGGLCPNEDDPAFFDKLLANERSNFKILYEKVSALGGVPLMVKHTQMSNTIPDEKVVTTYVSYLCLRLLDIREEVKAARVIQMAWRRRRLQQTFKQRLWAAHVIQKTYRKFIELKRMKLEKQREEQEEKLRRETQAAVIIQKFVRGFQVREDLKHVKKCAIILQSLWRRRKAKLTVDEMRLQKDWKERQERIRQEEFAAVTIQKFYRGKMAKHVVAEMRLHREREITENASAVTIQKSYRGFKVRKEQKRLEKYVTILQSLWRMQIARGIVGEMKLKRETEVREYFAAVKIQKCYRQFKVRKELQYRNKFATVLQCFWRVYLAKKVYKVKHQEREQEMKKEKSSISIQKYIRGWLCRRQIVKMQQAAICLQKHWRGNMGRKRAAFVLKQLHVHSAIIIQKCVRVWICRRRFKQSREAAICIQRMWRAFLIGQYLEQEEDRRQLAAVVIQAWFKKCAQQQKYQTFKSQVTLIQRKYRAVLEGRKVREELEKQTNAAVSLQKAWKQFVMIKEAKSLLEDKKEARRELERQKERVAALLIQSLYRGYQCRKEMAKMESACVKIQSLWRMQKAKRLLQGLREEKIKKAREMVCKTVIGFYHFRCFQKTKQATVVIQKNWRMVLAMRQLDMLRQSRNEKTAAAAICIQKNFRAHVARRDFVRVKTAAVTLQMHWRCFLIQKESACVKIQSLWRMQKAKRLLQGLREEKIKRAREMVCKTVIGFYHFRCFQKTKQATVVIQKNWRMVLAMRQLDMLRQSRNEKTAAAAICIQKNFRAHVARRDFVRVKTAAVTLQMHWRCFLIQKESACVKIQSLWRMQKAKRLLQGLREEKIKRAREMVCKTVIGFYHFRCFQKTKQATVVIQKNWRMVLAKRQLDMLRQSRNEKTAAAATCIQKNFRAHVARRDFVRVKTAAATLQMHWRCFLIRKELIKMQIKRNEQERAACILQAFVRGVLQRRSFLRVKNAAAVLQDLYQKNILAREQTEQDAAMVIQSSFRRYVCCRRYRAEREATLKIQDWFRRSLKMQSDRLNFCELRSSAITIQSCFRMYRDRKEFYRKREAVVKLQAFVRRIQAEEQYELKRNAALIIQMYFRAWKNGRIFHQAFNLIRNSCITIQRFYRKEKARKEKIKYAKNEAAVKIQSYYRGYMQRKKYLALLSATKCIQRNYRSIVMVRKVLFNLKRRTDAAIKIQSSWRSFVSIKEAKNVLVERRREKCLETERQKVEVRKNNAATILQRSWYRFKQSREAKREVEEMKKIKLKMEEESKREKKLRKDAAIVIQRLYRQYKLIQEAKVELRGKKEDMRLKQAEAKILEEQTQRDEVLKRDAACLLQKAYKQFKLMQEAKMILERRREVRRMEDEKEERRRQEEAAAFCIQTKWRQRKCIEEAKLVLAQKRETELRGEEERKTRLKEQHLAAVTIQKVWRQVSKLRKDKLVLSEEKASLLNGEHNENAKNRVWEVMGMKFRKSDCMKEEETGEIGDTKTAVIEVKELCKKDAREEDSIKESRDEIQQVEGDEVDREKMYTGTKKGQDEGSETEENMTDFLQCEEGRRRIEAAMVLQKHFRGYHQRCEFSKTIQAIIVIQSHFKGFIQRKAFEAYKASVCVLQQRWRERNLTRQLRKKFLQQTRVVCVIQAWYRRARQMKRERAAIRIQALWRGHSIRHNLKCKKLKAARKRLEEANCSDSKNTLGSRTASALAYLLADNDMAYILSALMNLEVSTRLSPECCERLVEADAVSVLVKLLSSCNRSVPHMEIIKSTTDILVNLANYNKTVSSLMEVHNLPSAVLNIMQIFREKGVIFYKSCALLGTLAKDPYRRQMLLKCPHLIDRIQSMHSLALRKQRTADRRPQKTPVKPAKVKVTTMTVFNDPLTAIQFLMSSLHLHPK